MKKDIEEFYQFTKHRHHIAEQHEVFLQWKLPICKILDFPKAFRDILEGEMHAFKEAFESLLLFIIHGVENPRLKAWFDSQKLLLY